MFRHHGVCYGPISRREPRATAPREESAIDLIFAYIDPGSGSLVIQALIAGLVAIPVIFRQRIAGFVRMVRDDGRPKTESAVQDDNVDNG